MCLGLPLATSISHGLCFILAHNFFFYFTQALLSTLHNSLLFILLLLVLHTIQNVSIKLNAMIPTLVASNILILCYRVKQPNALRGARPGTMAGIKRKATGDLSQNQNTVKARRRLANLSPMEQAVERAQNADRQAVRRAQASLRRTGAWALAEPSVRHSMEEEEEERVMKYR